MKGKIFVILLLLALLAFIVYKMMRHESQVREQQVITEYVEEDSAPLIEKKSREKLRSLSSQAEYYFRADGNYFKMLKYGYQKTDRHWETFLMKGVNLGVALPGKFPAEFAITYDQYMKWITKIGQMNANVIRVYTILPPEFYEAFMVYNMRHQDNTLYLLHGVWATQPPDHNYRNPEYTRNFKEEIIDLINVLHGNAVLEPEKGKASGVYSTDVSRYVAGLMLGREWEPNSVHITNQKYKTDHYYGDFVSLPRGNAMEAWLAEIMDFTVLYETQKYHMQHPVSFVNWLPLDPMYHNTEIIASEDVREFDNDLESIHFKNFHSSKMFIPGLYATYHAYPYYPDYVYLKDKYANATNRSGKKDNYIGYLRDLKSHHKGIPLVISEYGVPSSRGTSHVTPFGFDQGGHSEAEQARISMTLTRDIFHSGCAGAVYFEWADEWFKHNWLVMKFEKPFHDRKLWHNMENPEQNFGIQAMETRERTIDSNLSDWDSNFKKDGGFSRNFHADPTYFYLAGKWEKLDFNKHNLYIAIDTYGKEKGNHHLPFSNEKYERGFEFLAEFFTPDSANILVDEYYSVFTDIYNDSIPVYASRRNSKGKFVMQELLTNRGRESITGEVFDSVIVNRSPLKFGKSDRPESSNADWDWNAGSGIFELRLDWHLLNVSDPAKNYVLDDKKGTSKIEYTKTDGFRIVYFITGKNNEILKRFPAGDYYKYLWDTWEEPSWSSRLKPLYDSLKSYFRIAEKQVNLEKEKNFPAKEEFSIASWYHDKPGAVSISFNGSDYSQIEHALPVLDKYHVKASFGVVPCFIDRASGRYQLDDAGRRKRFSSGKVSDLDKAGHSLALQSTRKDNNLPEQYYQLEEQTGLTMNHLIYRRKPVNELKQEMEYSRPLTSGIHKLKGLRFKNFDNKRFTCRQVDSILEKNKNDWLIFNYQYLTEDTSGKKAKDLFVNAEIFNWQLRLARNHQYWVEDEWDGFRYRKEQENVKIRTTKRGQRSFLQLDNPLNSSVYDHPLTIRYQTVAPYIRVTKADGQYTLHNTTGTLYFDLKPGNEVTLKRIW